MSEFLYGNIGGRIKRFALTSFFIEAISAVIGGIVMFFIGVFEGEESFLVSGLLTMFLGPIAAWIGTWFMYAFGELVENSRFTRANTDYLINGMDYIVYDIEEKRAGTVKKPTAKKYTANPNPQVNQNPVNNDVRKAPNVKYQQSSYAPKPTPEPKTDTRQATSNFVHNEPIDTSYERAPSNASNSSIRYCNRCGAVLTSNECNICGAKINVDNKAEPKKAEAPQSAVNPPQKNNVPNDNFKKMVNGTSTDALMMILKYQRDSFSDEEIQIIADELRWRRGK